MGSPRVQYFLEVVPGNGENGESIECGMYQKLIMLHGNGRLHGKACHSNVDVLQVILIWLFV